MAKTKTAKEEVSDLLGPPPAGHNSTVTEAAKQLRDYVERIERLVEERKGVVEDIRDVIQEAKSQGFDAKAIRKILALRKMDPGELAEHEAIVDLYRQTLGM